MYDTFSLEDVGKEIMSRTNAILLKNHPNDIWQGSNGNRTRKEI